MILLFKWSSFWANDINQCVSKIKGTDVKVDEINQAFKNLHERKLGSVSSIMKRNKVFKLFSII